MREKFAALRKKIPPKKWGIIRGVSHSPFNTPFPMPEDPRQIGMRVRRETLGDAHVDRALAAADELDADFQRFITESAWGGVWARPGLPRKTRSLLAIALLAAGGHDEEVAMHCRACKNTGARPEEVREALMMVAVYAGVPAANRAFKIAREVFAENPKGDGE